MFVLYEMRALPECFFLKLEGGWEGKIQRTEHRHVQKWGVLIYRLDLGKRLLIEYFDKFEDAFYRARSITKAELDILEIEASLDDVQTIGAVP